MRNFEQFNWCVVSINDSCECALLFHCPYTKEPSKFTTKDVGHTTYIYTRPTAIEYINPNKGRWRRFDHLDLS